MSWIDPENVEDQGGYVLVRQGVDIFRRGRAVTLVGGALTARNPNESRDGGRIAQGGGRIGYSAEDKRTIERCF